MGASGSFVSIFVPKGTKGETMLNALRYHLRTYGLLEIALRHPRLLARLTGATPRR